MPANQLAVCSLFEGDYHYGAATLVNSLIENGFQGHVWFGIKGDLPSWAGLPPSYGDHIVKAGPVLIHFEKLSTSNFLASEKASFMQSILKRQDLHCSGVVYFDPDIVVAAPWSFVESWVDEGVAVCEDNCFGDMPDEHFIRLQWKRHAVKHLGRTSTRTLDRSYNSGFIGVSRKHESFLDDWSNCTNSLTAAGVDLAQFKPGNRRDPFFGTDQDSMNIALMINSEPMAVLGKEGMGFIPGMQVMMHAVDNPKPWRKRYISHLLRTGSGVGAADRAFWSHANLFISPWPFWRYWTRLASMKIAIILSRFYHSA